MSRYRQILPRRLELDSVAQVGVLPRWCSSTLFVRQESVKPLLLGSMPRAIDASASGVDGSGSSPAAWLLDILPCRRKLCLFPMCCVSLLSPQRRCLSSCLRFFSSSLYSSLESHLISCLSLNVARLVSSRGAQDTCTFVLVLECESCSADGSEVVAYCGLPFASDTPSVNDLFACTTGPRDPLSLPNFNFKPRV